MTVCYKIGEGVERFFRELFVSWRTPFYDGAKPAGAVGSVNTEPARARTSLLPRFIQWRHFYPADF